ncbi:hypothetical protein [Persicobacter psychrovividus]|uniref:Anti sigma-E protein RseA N-terminal domain-containing protein n=1 Tax=Persicobacter psychrovividus TaxID=387638 RepID=A0ABM7VDQ2_9BACT|nr:hypothetical protein PEPS_13400 [Persicobacter psychrovividus]
MRLHQIPKKNIDKVPQGYFQQLPDQIEERINAGNPIVPLWKKPAIRYASPFVAAASVALILFFSIPNQLSPLSPTTAAAAFSEAEIIDYLAMESSPFDSWGTYYPDQSIIQDITFSPLQEDEDLLEEQLEYLNDTEQIF